MADAAAAAAVAVESTPNVFLWEANLWPTDWVDSLCKKLRALVWRDGMGSETRERTPSYLSFGFIAYSRRVQ